MQQPASSLPATERLATAAHDSPGPNILVAYFSATGRTAAVGQLVAAGARLETNNVRVKDVADLECADLSWLDGLALGSPVYYGSMATEVKAFIDSVQRRCFAWPVTQMRWKAGAAFATGAHESSGKESVLSSLLAFFFDLQVKNVEGGRKR